MNPLGQLLVQKGVITPEQLEQACVSKVVTGNRLASECFFLGFAEEEDLLTCLSFKIGVPGIPLSRMVLSLNLLEMIPEAEARQRLVLPVHAEENELFLAMADPLDERQLREAEFCAMRSIRPCVALHGLLQVAIPTAYQALREGAGELHGKLLLQGTRSLQPSGAMLNTEPIKLVSSAEVALVPPELLVDENQEISSPEVVIHLDEGYPEDMIITFDDEDEEDEFFIKVEEPESCPGVEALPADHPAMLSPQEAVSSSGPLPATTFASKQLRVLVVDDDADLRQLMTRVLAAKGFTVETSSRGLEALGRIRRDPPDLLILDAMLPEIHGFDICRKIKDSERYQGIPIIIISSVYRGWRIARDLEESYGVEAFLEKPFSLEGLVKTVEQVVLHGKGRKGNDGQMTRQAYALYREAVRLYKKGEFDQAIQKCSEGIRVDPLSSRAHYLLGILYLKKQGQIYQAMHALEEAVTLDPELFAAQKSLAILYQRKGFKNKAIEMWERALLSAKNQDISDKIRKHLRSLL